PLKVDVRAPGDAASRQDRTVQGHNLDDSSTFADLGSSPSTLTAGGSATGDLTPGRPPRTRRMSRHRVGAHPARHRAHPQLRQAEPLPRSEEHTSELQSRFELVCRLLLEKKNKAR